MSEEEDENGENMKEGEERDDEGIWMDGEDVQPDDLRYNGEGKKNCCNTREHAEMLLMQSITTLVRS